MSRNKGEPIESSPSLGEITMEAYLADMRDEVEAAVAAGLLDLTPHGVGRSVAIRTEMSGLAQWRRRGSAGSGVPVASGKNRADMNMAVER